MEKGCMYVTREKREEERLRGSRLIMKSDDAVGELEMPRRRLARKQNVRIFSSNLKQSWKVRLWGQRNMESK